MQKSHQIFDLLLVISRLALWRRTVAQILAIKIDGSDHDRETILAIVQYPA
jgi:hypothetical protein